MPEVVGSFTFIDQEEDDVDVRGPVNFFTARDAALNDINKLFTPRPGRLTKISGCHIFYTCTAEAGTRLLDVVISDSNDNELYRARIAPTAGSDLIAGIAAKYNLYTAIGRTGFLAPGQNFDWPPEMYLLPQMSIRFLDTVAVDVLDDMIVQVYGIEYTRKFVF